jgi:hypothetical protein
MSDENAVTSERDKGSEALEFACDLWRLVSRSRGESNVCKERVSAISALASLAEIDELELIEA